MKIVTFKTRAEAEAYISGDKLECLECGKRFVLLEKHLRVAHSMTSEEYKQKYNIPVSIPLAGAGYREKQRLKMLRMQENGSIDYSHLGKASEKARTAGRGDRRDFDLKQQADFMKSINDSGRAYRRKKPT
ncbi:MucR family transcriptional regulator [Raoultella terrigena]|uniref:MucR family transcriptional regulator n=1 Tax=Raoultella terrigena TaxID=577 RepID=UPI00349F87AE